MTSVQRDARGLREDDEYLRHRQDSQRPGQAGSAAAARARLTMEKAGLLKACALTKRLLGDGGVARVAHEGIRREAVRPRADCA